MMKSKSRQNVVGRLVPIVKVPFLLPLLAAVAGIVVDRLLSFSMLHWFTGSIAFSALAWAGILFDKRKANIVFLSMATVCIFASWHHRCWSMFPIDEVAFVASDDPTADDIPICVEVIARSQPQIVRAVDDPFSTVPSSDRTVFSAEVQQIRSGRQWRPASGLTRITVLGHLTNVGVGDRIRLFGAIRQISGPMNPGERDFQKFARADRRLCQIHTIYPDCVTMLAKKTSGPKLQIVRTHFSATLAKFLNPRNQALISALLLGIRDGLPESTKEAFFRTGTMHLLAISGLHIGILAWAFFFFARRDILPYRFVLLFAMLAMLLYALLAESRPPVLRATILVQVVCLSWLARRRMNAFNSLALAGLILLALNPAEIFRIGTQLSFLAVFSLCVLARVFVPTIVEDPLDRLINRTRPIHLKILHRFRRKLAALVIASLVVWLVTLPLSMYYFHLVTPLAVFLNVILLPLVAACLMSALGLILAADLFIPLATVLAGACNLCSDLLQSTVNVALQLPISHFWVPGPHLFWLLLFYAAAAVCCFAKWRPNRRWTFLLIGFWHLLPLVVDMAESRTSDESVECTFVCVGHGTAALIELPGNKHMLYDCGHLGKAKTGVEAVSAVLWSRGVRHLDAIVISHADADHYNALPGIIDRFSIGTIYVGEQMFNQSSAQLDILQSTIKANRIPLKTVTQDIMFSLEHAEAGLSIIHPPAGSDFGSDNANSLVMLAEFQDKRLLLSGDLEKDGLESMTMLPALRCDVLMAPHHGSPNSFPRRMLDWTNPSYVVISADNNKYPIQESRYGETGATLFHTGVHGAVTVRMTSDEVLMSCFRYPEKSTNQAVSSQTRQAE